MIQTMLGRVGRRARRRGDAARDAGRWTEAAAHYRRWLGAHPGDVAIRVQLGHVLAELGRFDEADRSYAAAAARTPDDADLMLCWGHLARRRGDDARAADLYSRSLAIDGNRHAAAALRHLAPPEAAAEPGPEPQQVPEPQPEPAAAAGSVDYLDREVVHGWLAPLDEDDRVEFRREDGAIVGRAWPQRDVVRGDGFEFRTLLTLDRDARIVATRASDGTMLRNAPFDAAPAPAAEPRRQARETPVAWVAAPALAPGDEAALVIVSASGGVVPWAVARCLRPLAERGIAAVAVVLAEDAVAVGGALADAAGVLVRAPGGSALAIWADALCLCPALFAAPALWLIDARDAGLAPATLDAARAVDADLVAVGTGEAEPRVLRLRAAALSSWQLHETLAQARSEDQTAHAFVAAMLRAGVRVDWLDPAALPSDPLPLRARPTAAPLKVAFYGPWNYDNGLGAASRATIAALRHAGVALNLHPIAKPFHVHRPLAPPVDVAEFAGPPDVAVVHLNPDSWFLLTDAQRDAIRAAPRRIGYWVWEMAHLPPAWWHDFGSVDRIWAPSRYCAALFAAQGGAPVDIVPHAVPLPPPPSTPDAGARAALLRDLGVDPARRVVLFVFDGSSYLVRKNPAALVRAFAAAGLAARGWTLLLKTKHLMDRPDDGHALRALADGEPGVVLVDRGLDADALERLIGVADVYASPHASEGFGLTIAEAMAAGRPVVATDWGGSTDLLEDTTGYPVRAHRWRLPRDYGHYTKGGVWARVDEPALAAALDRAAAAAEAGDTSRGDAARARVGERLSYASVGRAIAASLADTVSAPPAAPPVRPETLNLRAGVPIGRGTGDARVALVALAADGAPLGDHDAGDAEWIAFAPAGSLVSPLFAATVLAAAAARPDADLFYADDIAGEAAHPVDQLRLKPDFDPVLLAAQDYVGAPVIVRATTLAALGGLNPARRTAAVADLLFRAHAAGRSIARIPEVLLAHSGARVHATIDDRRAMLEAQPIFAGHAIAPGHTPTSLALTRRFAPGAEPAVTIVIPTMRGRADADGAPCIETLLDALGQTDWPHDRLTVIVGDDVDAPAPWADAPRSYHLRRIATPRVAGGRFNYAAKMNRLWREAADEQLVFLNDDVRPGDAGWLRALQTFALDRTVGGVGARLLYEDGRLQHAGIVPHAAAAAHAWLGRRRSAGTYGDWALVHRQWSMVTGAVFATRRSLMEQIGGFDEAFAVEFNDLDLCLRLRALGLRIVYTPHAEMVHAEKVSRGHDAPAGDTIARFLERWGAWLHDDPSWHPGLRRDRLEVQPAIHHRQWYF